MSAIWILHPSRGRYHSPVDGALEIKDGIKERFGFTVNIGISTNKLLAKMASDFRKPDRIHTLFPEEIQVKMVASAPSEELYMAGRSSVETLKKLEINTIGDLAQADPELIAPPSEEPWEDALGVRERQRGGMWSRRSRKRQRGSGIPRPSERIAETEEEVYAVFGELAQSVGRRLKKAGKKAGMVSMEIKYHDFRTISHQMQLEKPSKRSGAAEGYCVQPVPRGVERRTGASARHTDVETGG